MVLQHKYIVLVALDVGIVVCGILGECFLSVTHTMALDVGFSRDIDTILIAKVIPARVVRVVAGTVGIDIELLHALDILNHAFHAHTVTTVWVEFMAVNSLDEHRLTIDEQLSVLDFHFSESNFLPDYLSHLVSFFMSDEQLIKMWSLSRPFQRFLHAEFSLSLAASDLHRFLSHRLACFILKIEINGIAISILSFHGHLKLSVAVVIGEVRRDENVGDACLRAGIEIGLTGDTTQAPEILVLQI